MKLNDEALAKLGIRRVVKRRDPSALAEFYADVHLRFPAVFERLCVSHSWTKAVIGEIALAANQAGPTLRGLSESVRYDPHLWAYLLPRGYLIFGRMSGGRWDPCAFDMNESSGEDAPVVRVDHEEILSFDRLGRPTLLASGFGDLLAAHLEGGRRTPIRPPRVN